MAILKPQSNRPSCSNTVIGTLAVDEWAVTVGTVRSGLSGLHQMQQPIHQQQFTNFILFDVAI